MMKRDTKRLEKPLLALQVTFGSLFYFLVGLYFFAGVNISSMYFYAVFMTSFAVFVFRGLRRR